MRYPMHLLPLLLVGIACACCANALSIESSPVVTITGLQLDAQQTAKLCRSTAPMSQTLSGSVSISATYGTDDLIPTAPTTTQDWTKTQNNCNDQNTPTGCNCTGPSPNFTPYNSLTTSGQKCRTGNGNNQCLAVNTKVVTRKLSTTYTAKQMKVTVGANTYTAAGDNPVEVAIADLGVDVAQLPEGTTTVTLNIVLSEIKTITTETTTYTCMGDLNACKSGSNQVCSSVISTSSMKTTNQETATATVTILKDLQAPVPELERSNKGKYTLNGEVMMDLKVLGVTSASLDLTLNGPAGAVETVPFTPTTKTTPGQGTQYESFGYDIPCRAPPGTGYTITASVNVGSDVCGQSWDPVNVTAKTRDGAEAFEVDASSVNVQADSQGLSVLPGVDPVLRSAVCFAATRNDNLNRTNTNPGAWHFGQVITFGGGGGCSDGALTFSGTKTTTLTLPAGFLWEKTGQYYVHLWANEPTGSFLDYQDPVGQLGAELTNGVVFTETFDSATNTITVDWSKIGQDADQDGNFAFTDLHKVYMRAKFRWNRGQEPPPTNTTFTLTSTAAVTELNGVSYPMDSTNTYTFDYLTEGCEPFPV